MLTEQSAEQSIDFSQLPNLYEIIKETMPILEKLNCLIEGKRPQRKSAIKALETFKKMDMVAKPSIKKKQSYKSYSGINRKERNRMAAQRYRDRMAKKYTTLSTKETSLNYILHELHTLQKKEHTAEEYKHAINRILSS
jgi:hypothetical protein